jgi:hypothetical protein
MRTAGSSTGRSSRPSVALAAIVAALPVAVVFLVSQRALVRGLVGGATSGSARDEHPATETGWEERERRDSNPRPPA